MGQEIKTDSFTEADEVEFRKRLREETKTLKRWFDERRFDDDAYTTVGLELEAWLLDENHLPAPRNTDFLKTVDDPDIVEELSRFNFEINAPPRRLEARIFSDTRSDLDERWQKCTQAAERLGLHPLAIGILPTVRDEMLQPHWMSDTNRYHALNTELFRKRSGRPLHICIEGHDRLDYRCDHLMLEAACTSLQSHLKVRQDDAVRLYNASVIAAAPLVAATCNSPYLYGKSLWCETRIPAFEQATALDGFRDKQGRNVLRVTMGTGYVRNSLLELYLENLDYPVLLPALTEGSEKLPHLRLQNGTIWRWVRPIVGFDESNAPHLRLEHRVIPAGPSLADVTANLALCHGLVLALGRADVPPESEIPFENALANFYACAEHGIAADVRWAGRKIEVRRLLADHLLPAAREALAAEGVAAEDLEFCFDEVLAPRIAGGQTGSEWQRRFMARHGSNFQALTERYAELQASGAPIHRWPV